MSSQDTLIARLEQAEAHWRRVEPQFRNSDQPLADLLREARAALVAQREEKDMPNEYSWPGYVVGDHEEGAEDLAAKHEAWKAVADRFRIENTKLREAVEQAEAQLRETEARVQELEQDVERALERASQEISNRERAQIFASQYQAATARMALERDELLVNRAATDEALARLADVISKRARDNDRGPIAEWQAMEWVAAIRAYLALQAGEGRP